MFRLGTCTSKLGDAIPYQSKVDEIEAKLQSMQAVEKQSENVEEEEEEEEEKKKESTYKPHPHMELHEPTIQHIILLPKSVLTTAEYKEQCYSILLELFCYCKESTFPWRKDVEMEGLQDQIVSMSYNENKKQWHLVFTKNSTTINISLSDNGQVNIHKDMAVTFYDNISKLTECAAWTIAVLLLHHAPTRRLWEIQACYSVSNDK